MGSLIQDWLSPLTLGVRTLEAEIPTLVNVNDKSSFTNPQLCGSGLLSPVLLLCCWLSPECPTLFSSSVLPKATPPSRLNSSVISSISLLWLSCPQSNRTMPLWVPEALVTFNCCYLSVMSVHNLTSPTIFLNHGDCVCCLSVQSQALHPVGTPYFFFFKEWELLKSHSLSKKVLRQLCTVLCSLKSYIPDLCSHFVVTTESCTVRAQFQSHAFSLTGLCKARLGCTPKQSIYNINVSHLIIWGETPSSCVHWGQPATYIKCRTRAASPKSEPWQKQQWAPSLNWGFSDCGTTLFPFQNHYSTLWLFMEVISRHKSQSKMCSLDAEIWSFLEYFISFWDNETL